MSLENLPGRFLCATLIVEKKSKIQAPFDAGIMRGFYGLQIFFYSRFPGTVEEHGQKRTGRFRQSAQESGRTAVFLRPNAAFADPAADGVHSGTAVGIRFSGQAAGGGGLFSGTAIGIRFFLQTAGDVGLLTGTAIRIRFPSQAARRIGR